MDKDFTIQGIKKIKEASINNKLVIFVGSGVSANSGLPSWSNLIRKFANELNFEINESDNSIETFLKIPQIFYNERGEKEYFDKLNESFQNNKFYPNAIHDKLIRLNPVHFVTTNYDDLLEQATQKNVAFYHTVKSDLDLPYNSENRMIIKMHGDFEMKNIVLKEDDYLSYSSNFLLIENYLRALISTNLILFVGYSANDPNFKLIFQRVKGVLKSHFQRAYLLDLQEKPNFLNFNYYKNIGINILYYESIESVIEKKHDSFSHYLGNRLMDFLNILADDEKNLEYSNLENIYSKLSVFNNFNAVLPNDIIKVLGYQNTYYDSFGKQELFFDDPDNIFVKIMKKESLSKIENSFLEKIIFILKKANISGIYIFESQERPLEKPVLEWNIDESPIDQELDELLHFDFSKIQQRINDFDNTPYGMKKDYQKMMRKAFLYYKIGQYSESYELLCTISNNSFFDKNYAIYFISEFNRKYLSKLIKTDIFSLENNKKTEDVNLESIYNKLPNKERNIFLFFRDTLNFNVFYQNVYYLDKSLKNVEEQKVTLENGGFNTSRTIVLANHRANNLLNLIMENHLMIEHYNEVKLFFVKYVEMVLTSYSIEASQGVFKNVKYPKFVKLDYIIFYFIVNFIKEKEINQLLKKLNLVELKLELEVKQELLKSLENIIFSINSNIENKGITTDLFRKTLNIISYIDIDIKEYESIIDKLSFLSKKSYSKFFPADFEAINKFIVNKFNKFNLSSDEKLRELFEVLVNIIIMHKDIEPSNYRGMHIIKNIVSILVNSNNKSHQLNKNIESINSYLIYQIAEKKYNDVAIIIIEILIPLFSLMNNKFRKQARKIIMEFLNNKVYENKYEIYYLCCMNDIFKKKKVIGFFFDELINGKYLNTNMIINLILHSKIEVSDFKKEFKKLKGESDFLDFLIAPNNFDIKKFDLSWLQFVDKSSELQEKIFKNNILKLQIQKLLEEEIRKSLNQNLINQFHKYFTPN